MIEIEEEEEENEFKDFLELAEDKDLNANKSIQSEVTVSGLDPSFFSLQNGHGTYIRW